MNGFENVYLQIVPLKGKGLFAKRRFDRLERIFEFTGTILPLEEGSALSLQINETQALESICQIDDNLNHSCHPNCYVSILNDKIFLVAITDIEVDEELTFNYNTTEYDMVSQGCDFKCHCREDCTKHIAGFKYLNLSEVSEIKELLIPYLTK